LSERDVNGYDRTHNTHTATHSSRDTAEQSANRWWGRRRIATKCNAAIRRT